MSAAETPIPYVAPTNAAELPLQFLKGVGPQVAEALARLGIKSAQDLLRHIPKRWEDRTRFRRVADLQAGEIITVCGTILAVTTKYPRPKMAITQALLDDGGSALTLFWFNQPFMERTFKTLAASRRPIVAYGQIRRNGWAFEMQNPEWEELGADGDTLSANRIVPIYALTEGVRQGRIRKLVDQALQTVLPTVRESLPPEILLRYQLVGVQAALRNIHFPESEADLYAARRRLVFEEFFLLQTRLARKRRENHHEGDGIAFQLDAEKLNRDLREIVPFELTNAQKRAIREIASDVTSGRAMNRLLQGDVGSGKTMVALAGMLMAIGKRLSGRFDGPDRNIGAAARDCSAPPAGTDGPCGGAFARQPAGKREAGNAGTSARRAVASGRRNPRADPRGHGLCETRLRHY